MTRTVALATAIAATGLDQDLQPLLTALDRIGIGAEMRAWDDPTVSWSRYELVVLRSTWDYTRRLDEFLAWCRNVANSTRLLNPIDVVLWNTDKRYLADLHSSGVAVVPGEFFVPGDDPAGMSRHQEFVVKPCVGAGSRDVRRFTAAGRNEAIAHATELLERGRAVLVQPYLAQVDEAGETALIYFNGEFSHAIRKGPLLPPGEAATRALFAAEHIQPRTPSAAELALAQQALAAQPFGRLAYARVDLLPSPDGPRLLELELCEPSLFFDHADGSALRFAEVIAQHLATPL